MILSNRTLHVRATRTNVGDRLLANRLGNWVPASTLFVRRAEMAHLVIAIWPFLCQIAQLRATLGCATARVLAHATPGKNLPLNNESLACSSFDKSHT
jgi:hypothetical protein